MTPILKRVAAGEILVADGAIGTLLMQRGLKAGECPESVNLERPEDLEEIVRLYLDAGADIVQTNWQCMGWMQEQRRSTALRWPRFARWLAIAPTCPRRAGRAGRC